MLAALATGLIGPAATAQGDRMTEDGSKEREILVVMRKLLAQIIKDTTPPSRAMKHPLKESTIEDIRQALALISARERELADAAGVAQERPYYTDDASAPRAVPLTKIGRRKPGDS
jgi:hypothetical protein